MATPLGKFLNEPHTPDAYASARFAVLPIPYDSTTSFLAGTRDGPAAIIAASHHLEDFDDELEIQTRRAGIATLDPVEPNVDGPKAMHADIAKAARRAVRDGKFVIGLGGDHSVTGGLVQAAMGKHRKLSVLQIDAHSDLRESYHGSRYSHACVMRRVLDMGASVVPVGIRSVAPEEHRFMRRAKIEPVTARDCHTDDDWVDRVLNALGDSVYVTIDIDGLDPAFAPGTGTPVPGGLDWYQVTGLLRLVAAEKRIIGADVVEVMPIGGQVVTEYTAAKLVYRLMGYIVAEGG